MTWEYLSASFPCSPEPAADSSAQSSSDGAPSAELKSTPIAVKSSSRDKRRDISITSLSGRTSQPSTGDPGVDAWISSLVDSPVRTCLQLAPAPASMEKDRVSGRRWPASSLTFDPLTSSWRTRQYSLLGGLEEFLGTWSRWGFTIGMEYWAQDTSAPHIDGIGYGLSAPTPTAGDTEVDPMWPTPAAALHNLSEDAASFLGRQEKWKGTYSNGIPLTVAVKLVPPGAKPVGSFGAGGAYATGRSADARESTTGMSSTARERWPTPTASQHKGSSPGALTRRDGRDRSNDRLDHCVMALEGGQLNPDWVEGYLMGWPVGWTSLEPIGLGDWWAQTWWNEEPAIPRITTIKTNRAKRLKAIGNGQVPACMAAAWRLLSVTVGEEAVREAEEDANCSRDD